VSTLFYTLITLLEGFERLGIWVVFNAGGKIKPQHSLTMRGFNFCDKAEDDQKTVLHSLLIKVLVYSNKETGLEAFQKTVHHSLPFFLPNI
jgi:hypothetical protein